MFVFKTLVTALAFGVASVQSAPHGLRGRCKHTGKHFSSSASAVAASTEAVVSSSIASVATPSSAPVISSEAPAPTTAVASPVTSSSASVPSSSSARPSSTSSSAAPAGATQSVGSPGASTFLSIPLSFYARNAGVVPFFCF